MAVLAIPNAVIFIIISVALALLPSLRRQILIALVSKRTVETLNNPNCAPNELQDALKARLFGVWLLVTLLMVVKAARDTAGHQMWTVSLFSQALCLATALVVWRLRLVSRSTAAKFVIITNSVGYLSRAYGSGKPFWYLWQFSPAAFWIPMYIFWVSRDWAIGALLFLASGSFVLQVCVPPIHPVWIDPSLLEEFYGAMIQLASATMVLGFLSHVAADAKVSARKMQSVHESASRVKDEFVAMVSHELRTPLNGVLGSVQLLLLDSPYMSAAQKEHLDCIYHSSALLNLMANNILIRNTTSVVEARRLVHARTFAGGLQSILAAFATFKPGVRIVVSLQNAVPEFVWVHPMALLQVLVNLGSNAIKYQESGLVRIVVVSAFQDTTSMLRFEVCDEGVGVSPEFLERGIFEAYSRDEQNANVSFGTGLGLNICRKLVTDMGGRIGCHRNPIKGTTFWLEVPLPRAEDVKDEDQKPWSFEQSAWGAMLSAPATSAPDLMHWSSFSSSSERISRSFPHSPRSASHNDAPPDILIVDDTPLNHQVMKGFLRKLGYDRCEVVTEGASSVQWLLERAKRGAGSRRPVVFLDFFMPVMSGQDAVALWRLVEERMKLPRAFIIGMTAWDTVNHDNAFDVVLRKPLLVRDIAAVMERYEKMSSMRSNAGATNNQ